MNKSIKPFNEMVDQFVKAVVKADDVATGKDNVWLVQLTHTLPDDWKEQVNKALKDAGIEQASALEYLIFAYAWEHFND